MKMGRVVKVAGPLVVAENMSGAKMYDMVFVSDYRLMGEIIELKGDRASIQVYEETGGIGPGDPVYPTGMPLSVELGPGLLTTIYDGVQRPLERIKEKVGDFITRGVHVPGLDREKKWHFVPKVREGETVGEGDVVGVVQETSLIEHRLLVPPGIKSARVLEIKEGEFTVEDVVYVLEVEEGGRKVRKEFTMIQKWPVRKPRPYREKLPPKIPMYTGQRVIDTFFPIAKGGTGCVPGPFGSGKTVIQHQLAKWADAEIIVYIGCGERGNEMTEVLIEFPELEDPKSGKPLMERTILIANTSNMPVAAREASVYTGITIAEYFRDMGYSVALMADSTSRWAEAMREISGRLEEMPGEEGYPAYLGARIASFYERAGRVVCLGKEGREGALTVVGAVSPPGGDLSDPVVQATLRVVKVFWSLEAQLAYQRHFPAISWLNSYSLYSDVLADYVRENVSEEFVEMAREAMRLLEKEAELQEIVRLVGVDALGQKDQLLLEVTRSIREDFLHQNAFHEVDTYASIKKQYLMLKTIFVFYEEAQKAVERGLPVREIREMEIVERIAKMKYFSEKELGEIEKLWDEIPAAFQEALKQLA
jgi:V/A-type H+-transporting ATPase subunit A